MVFLRRVWVIVFFLSVVRGLLRGGFLVRRKLEILEVRFRELGEVVGVFLSVFRFCGRILV